MEVFIVRLWPDPQDVRGRVEHVPTGRSALFRDAEALVGFLSGSLGAPVTVDEEEGTADEV